MTRTLHRTLLLAALVTAPALASGPEALAQPANPPPANPPPANPPPARPAAPAAAPAAAAAEPADGLSPQDREVVAAAEALAKEASQAIEQWIVTQASTEDKVFARLYYPVAKTDPLKFNTPYDTLADRDIVPLEDKTLARSAAWQYAIITDVNAYVPAHNTRFAKPLTGVTAQDYAENLTKRMFGDLASLKAARNEKRILIQDVQLETGDVIIRDVSVPIMVRGKHWGCARIGYRRSE